jgi:hypothetical protein
MTGQHCGIGGVRRPSASPSIAGIVLHCREPAVANKRHRAPFRAPLPMV